MSTAVVWLLAAVLWLGSLIPGAWWLGGITAAALVVGARSSGRRTRLVLAVLGVLLLGSAGSGVREALLDRGALVEIARRGGEADVVATVVADARLTEHGAWTLVRTQTVNGRATRQRAAMRLESVSAAPQLGSLVRFSATARPLEREDFDGYLRGLHAATMLTPAAPPSVVRGPGAVLRSTNVVRAKVRAAAVRHLDDDVGALLTGLVIGDTGGMSAAAEDAMRAAGLSHLVAVSGSNVALVLAGAVMAGAMLRLGARGRRRLCLAAVLWFAVLVRAEPSVLRATTMAALVLAAAATGRGADTRHTLGVAVILLLLVDPFLARQIGFSLSVLATGGVVVLAPLIAQRLRGPRPLRLLIGATLGAQAGVAPVLIFTEGGLHAGALPANLIAVPVAAVASSIGIAAAVLAQLSVAGGAAVAVFAAPPLRLILWAGRTFAGTGALRPEHLASPAAAAVAVAVLLRLRGRRATAAAVCVVAAVSVAGPWHSPPPVRTLTLTALDVGQGDALLVEVPAGGAAPPARMLVDAGPDAAAALRALRSRRVGSLDAVVVSHPHADHTDGLPAVLTRIPAGALIVGPHPPHELDEPSASAVATEVVAAQRGVPVVRVSAGQRFRLGHATVEVLSPPADGSLGREPNDNSLVLRVSTPHGSILLTGDAEEAAQRRLLRRPDLLRADVLKVPHHGGNTNSTGFLDAVGAQTAVIGVGTDNDYGHPHPDVLADLEGIRVLRTDVHGPVTVVVE